jgi:hypothetical protein
MYFANMFCYGSAQDKVGITGIRGCMGIVYIGGASMYALHIPPDSDDVQKMARVDFEAFVKNNEPVAKGSGYLFAFVNGKNRPSAVDEMKDMKKRLNAPPTIIYRMMKHLGQDSGGFGADSVAIMLERWHASTDNPSGCLIWYKRNDDITWVGGGARESGQYKPRPAYQGDEVPSEFNAHWWRMDGLNCTIANV